MGKMHCGRGGHGNMVFAHICVCCTFLTSTSRVHNRWNEVFLKILKKPSIVQKKNYLIWQPLVFALIKNKNKNIFFLKTPITKNKKFKTKQNVIFQLHQFSVSFDQNFMDWLVELIDVKDIDVAQLIWLWECRK